MRIPFLKEIQNRIHKELVELTNREIPGLCFELEETPYHILVEREEDDSFSVSLIVLIDDDPSGILKYDYIESLKATRPGDIIFKINDLCDNIAYEGREVAEITKELEEGLSSLSNVRIESKHNIIIIYIGRSACFLVLHNDWILGTSMNLLWGRVISKCKTTEDVIERLINW